MPCLQLKADGLIACTNIHYRYSPSNLTVSIPSGLNSQVCSLSFNGPENGAKPGSGADTGTGK